jgi:hypothetical protein
MSAMADRIADLCGCCNKDFPECGCDMNDCLADDEAKKIDALKGE